MLNRCRRLFHVFNIKLTLPSSFIYYNLIPDKCLDDFFSSTNPYCSFDCLEPAESQLKELVKFNCYMFCKLVK